MSQESDQPIHPNVLQAMRAQAYPEILDNNGMPWYINSLRERGEEVTKITAERDALLVERDRLRGALEGLFAGGFIEAGTRGDGPWESELASRLIAAKDALNAR